uniref:Delta-1-pyrroline-5-carboxylate dehydrogenase, mitochondrial n=1 Tax=Panagrolaimus sp. PS1159 TaxID=55785 RepID=A0AC35EZJ2_9BILA
MASSKLILRGAAAPSVKNAIRCGSTFTNLTSEQFMKKPTNEPILDYKKGSTERKALEKALEEYASKVIEVPLCIGKERITRKLEHEQTMPSDHKHAIAKYTWATENDIKNAIETGLEAREKWHMKTLEERADILLHAADLCAGKYRMALNATTMLGQGKNILQAEIDAACELIDFFRFNAYFALDLEKYQPISTKASKNSMLYRALEGFVAAIAPFNFTAIGGNLASAPALMGNVVLWKPSDTAVLSNYIIYQILEEAGIPPGVISFLPSDGPVFGNTVCDSKHLAAINFTGSVPTFKYIWKRVGNNLDKYISYPKLIGGNTVCDSKHLAAINFTGSVPTFKYIWKRVGNNLDKYISYPKLIGECGGKNFHFIHPSADMDSVAPATIRSAYEYSGQKCSACSRIYLPESQWQNFKDKFSAIHKQLKMGDVRDGSIFLSSVIDGKSFARIKKYIDAAKSGEDGAKIILGGKCDDSKGYFVEPTLIQVTNPESKILTEEIFGPVLTAYVYPDSKAEEIVRSIKDATPYGLTGAVFSGDKDFLYKARDILRDAVGNLYLNDKSTGSIVGQQPFGGARMSGTNDKAGGPHYALRWSSPQTIKETFEPVREWRYQSMD